MPILLTDPATEERMIAERESTDAHKWDEVWDGVLVMPTQPNTEHQIIQARFLVAFASVFPTEDDGVICAGVNVSDRHPDWQENFRCPDVVVYLPDTPAINHDSHWMGGPDFLVEIISPGDLAWDKLEFYAKVNTREVLFVDRVPWCLELYRLKDGVLKLAGESNLANPAVLTSEVIPFTFQLTPGSKRPLIQLTHTTTGQIWAA